MISLVFLCLSLSTFTIWTTIAQIQQHLSNQASTISQSSARVGTSLAKSRAATAASIVANTKAVHPNPPQYELVHPPQQKSDGARQRVSEDAPIKHTQTSRHNQNIYTFQKVAQKAHDKLGKCVKPPSCTTYRGFYGYALDEYSMVDTKKKILMEFSPKADCTAAVVAFLETSGYQQNDDYFGWPHIFRERYYDRHCGEATHCLYYDPTWFRFKVVRNPFDRAVSSYLYVMKTGFLNEFLPKHIKRTSFEGFINYLLTLSPDVFQYFCTRHAGPQSQYYERFVYTENKKFEEGNSTMKNPYPPVFHEIVKLEDSKQSFERIHHQTGIRYQLKYSSKTHFQSRN
eukprot:gene17049-19506_t